jgi:hypothetical protein
MDFVDGASETTLERLLRQAASEPAHRPEFYKTLLNSNVFVLGTAGRGNGSHELEGGSKIKIASWEKQDGSPAIPFFTSLSTLLKAIDSEQTYLELPARSLFEATAGTTLFLNPKGDFGKEFSAQEISNLLANGGHAVADTRQVEHGTRVLIGQPAQYPTTLIDSVAKLLAKHPRVIKAYLGLMHDTSQDEKPCLAIGIELDGDFDQVKGSVGAVALDTAPKDEAVYILKVEKGDDGISRYLRTETTPFYERSWSTRVRALFGIGKS